MKLYRHFTANGVSLDPFPFKRELAMEAYIVENQKMLELDDTFKNVEIIQHEVSVKNGRSGRDGRIDILASYDEESIAIVELKKEELSLGHLSQLEDYLKQRHAIFNEHPSLLDEREHLRESKSWIGILVGTHIESGLARKLEEGFQIDDVPVAALVMQRYKSADGNVYVATERYFRNLRQKDKTQYTFEGATYGKGRLVLAVIQSYVRRHPGTTFATLREAFPSNLQGGSGVFSDREAIDEDWKRHFSKPDEIIRLGDTEIVVSTQWGIGNIGAFIEHVNARALALGSRIEAARA